jgi:NADPH:quinone reductase
MVSLSKLGGPEVIELIDKELPPPGKGEVQLRQTAIGFNFITSALATIHWICRPA